LSRNSTISDDAKPASTMQLHPARTSDRRPPLPRDVGGQEREVVVEPTRPPGSGSLAVCPGHAETRTTITAHDHVFDGIDQAAADRLDEAVSAADVRIRRGFGEVRAIT
jgi:hypothetical protein